jgi:m7GpppX diphosphatase
MKRAMRAKNRNVIHETPEVYFGSSMREFVEAEISKKSWIYKVIAGEKEQDQVIFRDDEYLVLPDTEATNEPGILNWMVIFTDTTLTSMRALKGHHIKLLETIKSKIISLIPAEFDPPMIYFHYPPSVWQLHLHVAAPCDILRTTNSMQKVCFLEDVMSNLTIDPEYYAKATLSYVLPTGHEISVINGVRNE